MHHLTRLMLTGAALVSPITLTLLSAYIEHVGPELVEYGNLCGPGGSGPCYQPVLKGGFPLPYLFDAPGISVERQLAFVEDNMSITAFVVDIAIYLAIVLFAMLVAARHRIAKPWCHV